jgi:hypothetical protein
VVIAGLNAAADVTAVTRWTGDVADAALEGAPIQLRNRAETAVDFFKAVQGAVIGLAGAVGWWASVGSVDRCPAARR